MAKNDNWLEFEGIVEAETPKAVMFKGDFWDKAEWVPKSQCRILERNTNVVPERMLLEIKEWLCEKNGWENG